MTPVDNPQEFLRICVKNGLRIESGQFDLFCRYVDLLLRWNSKINLISRRDVENVWFSHILHSLAPWFRLSLPPGRAVLDIGSGGGLPGIPLAILRGDLSVLLLDSKEKKTTALSEISSSLRLSNVQVLNARAEDIGRSADYASRFSTVLARGVAPLTDLIRWSRPFLCKEGTTRRSDPDGDRTGKRLLDLPCLLAWKGGNLDDEVGRASRRFGTGKLEVLPLSIEGVHTAGLEGKQLVIVMFD